MEGLKDRNSLLLYLSSKLDSTIHLDQEEELRSLKIINSFLSALGKEECIPTGSCVEGSKVNVPGDIGDVDILIISGRFVLTERLFEYIPGYPAFLRIRGTDEHFTLFKDVGLVDDVYLPMSILKDLNTHVFDLIRTIVRGQTAFNFSKDDSAFTHTRHSAVGLEKRELEGMSAENIGVRYHNPENNVRIRICQMGQFLNDGMDRIIEVNTGKKIQKEFEHSSTTSNPKCNENVGDSLVRIVSEIKHKMEHFDDDSGSESEDETKKLESEKTVCGSRYEPTVSLPLSTLKISENIDDELEICFENDLESASTVEDAVPDERCEAIRDTYLNNGGSMHANRNEENDKATKGEIYVPFSRIRSTDFVPAFRFTGWPRPAEEWIIRERHWPSIEVRDQIIKTGCQVIAKPLPFMKENENKVYFRLSFALSETILANCMTESQKVCWKILKAYQKGFLCTEPRVLASYHWKTAILWISESKAEGFWTPENVIYGVSEALEFMIDCLTKRCVPHYFVRNMNLFADCHIEVMDILKQKVTAILRDPVTYLRRFVQNPPSPKPCKITEEEMEQIRAYSTSDMFDEKSGDLLDSFSGIFKSMKEENDERGFPTRFPAGARNFVSNIKTHIEQKCSNDRTVEESSVISGIFETTSKVFKAFTSDRDSEDDNARSSQMRETGKKLLGSVGTLIFNRLTSSGGTKNKQPSNSRQESKETQTKMHKSSDIELD